MLYLYNVYITWASLVAQLVKNLPAMWETWVQSMGWEDPLEKGMATHSNILENSMDYIVYICMLYIHIYVCVCVCVCVCVYM